MKKRLEAVAEFVLGKGNRFINENSLITEIEDKEFNHIKRDLKIFNPIVSL